MAAAVRSAMAPSPNTNLSPAIAPSPNTNLSSHFSPYSDSPSSPAYPHQVAQTKRSSTDASARLAPDASKSPTVVSPSDIADPSPIASSNGTDATDIEQSPLDDDPTPQPATRTSIHLPQIPEQQESPQQNQTSPRSDDSTRRQSLAPKTSSDSSPLSQAPSSSSDPSNQSQRAVSASEESSSAKQPDSATDHALRHSDPKSDKVSSQNGSDINPTSQEPQTDRSLPNRASIRVATKDAHGSDLRRASSDDDQPPSVIHAPGGFKHFHMSPSPKESNQVGRVTPTPSQRSDFTVISPDNDATTKASSPASPPPLTTAVPQAPDTFTTPRAQTLQEAEALENRKPQRPADGLAAIPEGEPEDPHAVSAGRSAGDIFQRAEETAALRTALGECWTLCNTLAGLSHIHRERSFRQNRTDGRGQAWESCWRLCQMLYDTFNASVPTAIGPTLNLCREFCQSLFEVRQRESDRADSVLRVSFELNNHLYNTHDRALPEAFRERTLDFYITLCHRLMKQRGDQTDETNALLRACWSLAEMLFSLRQNQREGKPADEELLGSAVQACWELCDLFREGWTQIRPDRGTPRPSEATFVEAFQQAARSATPRTISMTSSEVDDEDEEFGRLHPETPTTIFEDTNQFSPDDGPVPNIVVLGPEAMQYGVRMQTMTTATPAAPQTYYPPVREWATPNSGAGGTTSTHSGYSRKSGTTASSTSTIINPVHEDPRLTCLRLLIVRAAINLGFNPRGAGANSTDPSTSSSSSASNSNASNPRGSFSTADTHAHSSTAASSTSATEVSAATNSGGINSSSSNNNNPSSSTESINKIRSGTADAGLGPAVARTGAGEGGPNGSLPAFVRSIPSNSFGTDDWQIRLLEAYRRLVTSDPSFRRVGPPRRATAPDVARSVQWMVRAGQYVWLEDLYRWVFGFRVDEAVVRQSVAIQS